MWEDQTELYQAKPLINTEQIIIFRSAQPYSQRTLLEINAKVSGTGTVTKEREDSDKG